METNRKFLALLRGINVGGNGVIKMSALKATFEGLGLSNVRTYIASGNVLFEDREKSPEKLMKRIEPALEETFRLPIRVVVLSAKELRDVVTEAPEGFGQDPEHYRYDVIFLRKPVTAAQALRSVAVQEGVDTVAAGRQVLYFSRLIARAAQSRLRMIVQLPIYKDLTVRNWNTTTKLLELMEARAL